MRERAISLIAVRRLSWGSLGLWVALAGCTSTPSQKTSEIGQLLESEVGEVDQSMVARILNEGNPKTKRQATVEGEIHSKIKWWLRYYSIRDQERFQRNLERGERYRALVQQILSEYQLPTELYYLAMIESGFVQHATSTASAVGIWQFMRPTALNYGLDVDANLDERRHPILATIAAARYLKDLRKKFNCWYLAIAAYNAGQGRIARAIQKSKTNDFWTLVEKKALPEETMDYIPKFFAAATIGNHLNQFGFEKMKPKNPWPEVMPVRLRAKTIDQLAQKTGVSTPILLRLNPGLRSELKQAQSRWVKIWIPKVNPALANLTIQVRN